MSQKNKKALVSLVIGETYRNLWDKYCAQTWKPYAEKHGYDIILIDKHIDETPRGKERTPHWQKLLILEAEETQGYDHIVWIDTDITINFNTAPCIVESNNSEKVGVIRYNEVYLPEFIEGGFSRAVRQNASAAVREAGVISYAERYERCGLKNPVNDLINTGVLVLTPKHKQLLRDVYDNYEETPLSAKENLPLSHHLLTNDMANGLDGRFNKVFDTELMHHAPYFFIPGIKLDTKTIFLIVNSIYINSFFLHFIDGVSRGYMQMVIPGAEHPTVFQNIELNAPKQEFIIGTHFAKY